MTAKKGVTPPNAIERDAIWTERIQSEQRAAINTGGVTKAIKNKNQDFWHQTEASVIFSGHGYNLDYRTTLEDQIGRKPPVEKEIMHSTLPEDHFVPELGYATSSGDHYGYGEAYKEKTKNLRKELYDSFKSSQHIEHDTLRYKASRCTK